MPPDKEIDIVAHVLYDQDAMRAGVANPTPLLALGRKFEGFIETYKARAREILVAAERVRKGS